MKQEKSDINDLINDNQKLRELLTSIVVDAESMRTDYPEWLDRLNVEEEEDHWFGGFEEGTYDRNDYSGTYIQWPNLSILIEQAKEQLKKETKWTTNKKSKTDGQQVKN